MRSKIIDMLLPIAKIPDLDQGRWLEGAEDSVSVLKDNLKADEILLYASGPHLLIHSVLTFKEIVEVPDHEDLDRAHIMPDDAWCIQRSYGGGEGHRVYLEPPLSNPGCNSLVGSEKLVFIRTFEGVKDFEPPVEIDQKLVHALGLFFLDERSAYCRLNGRGDIENVITIHDDTTHDPWERLRAVTIRSHDLATYMALGGTSLVTLFDFTRFSMDEFSGWDGAEERTFETKNLFYGHRKIPKHASYANGQIILRTGLTLDSLVEEWKAEEDTSTRQYASFKITDWKNDSALVESSCGPDHIVNYFTESGLPWEISPAFFRPDVLQKYKSDPEKYTFGDRSISCRGSWHLKTYDINQAGQVHTYIGYLANLPYEEQLYWQSFNEWPKANISERAYQNDILGEFSTTEDPLNDLKVAIQDLDRKPPSWWKPRGEALIESVHYPVTDSASEWGDEILALDHVVVEGFLVKGLREIASINGGSFEKNWASLKVLEAALSVTGRTEDQAREAVSTLKELHALRNPAKAHGDPQGRRLAIANARKAHGTLRNHFIDLTERLSTAFKTILTTLPK
jgi:hypothetical protein